MGACLQVRHAAQTLEPLLGVQVACWKIVRPHLQHGMLGAQGAQIVRGGLHQPAANPLSLVRRGDCHIGQLPAVPEGVQFLHGHVPDNPAAVNIDKPVEHPHEAEEVRGFRTQKAVQPAVQSRVVQRP